MNTPLLEFHKWLLAWVDLEEPELETRWLVWEWAWATTTVMKWQVQTQVQVSVVVPVPAKFQELV